jgi:hypothetical protein
MRSINAETDLCKKVKIVLLICNMPNKIMFSDKDRDKFGELNIKWNSSSINIKELILEFRSDDLTDWVAKFGFALAIIIVLNNVDAFQVVQGSIVPPHLQWLWEKQP